MNYDVKSKQVTEWNVGCERCHGAGSVHARDKKASTIVDYLATGLPRAGDQFGNERFLDRASPWSLSFVLVLPLAPLSP